MARKKTDFSGLILAALALWALVALNRYISGKLGLSSSSATLVLVGVGVALVLAWVFIFGKSVGVRRKTLRGMDRVSASAFAALARKLLKGPRARAGIQIHPDFRMERGAEAEHMAVIGTTGAGKTKALINRVYLEAQGRGDKVILWDVKGDFTAALAENPDAMLVAPWDARSIAWDIGADIEKGSDCDIIAESAIPDSSDEKENFFRKQSRAVFSAILQCLWNENKLTWKELAACIADINETLSLLSMYQTGQMVISYIENQSGQTQATWTTLVDHAGKWTAKAAKAWPEPSVSLRSWLQSQGGGTLILRYSPDYPDLSASICSMVTSLLINSLLALPEDENRAVWFLLDEMANFPKVGNLKRGVTLARDRGGRFVLSAQDVTQLFPIYGKENTKTLINQCNTQVWLRANDGENAKIASESLGNKEELLIKTSESNKVGFDKESSFSTSHDLRTVAVIEPGEFMALRHSKNIKNGGAEAFFKMSGVQKIAKLVWPLTFIPAKYKPEVTATWVNEKEERLI